MEKTIEKMNWRTVIDAQPETPQSTIDALDKYFEAFAQVSLTEKDGKKILGEQPCIKCDEPLNGMMAMMFGKGGFTWGIAHGEGHCKNCGWPARAYHFIKDSDGKDLMTLRNVILQYHPDYVTERKRKKVA
jgi:hypothetical protein